LPDTSRSKRRGAESTTLAKNVRLAAVDKSGKTALVEDRGTDKSAGVHPLALAGQQSAKPAFFPLTREEKAFLSADGARCFLCDSMGERWWDIRRNLLMSLQMGEREKLRCLAWISTEGKFAKREMALAG
jgi:hypothetical protein